jgi:hypothetical protein
METGQETMPIRILSSDDQRLKIIRRVRFIEQTGAVVIEIVE